MTDANCEGFPICDDRITENDRCVKKIKNNWHTLIHTTITHNYSSLHEKLFDAQALRASTLVNFTSPT